jgi:3-hydroxyacyl-CoA dehydrogenase/enoyl-CoA hydratase/3-hydroxybutyryl-CoA epimerase
VFNRLAALTIPTVAAIHGACVGGGFELALTCERRLATPASTTRIGLPETKLGLIPAWGGCTRLPRLVGIPKALEIILGGKTLRPERALKLGMIDEIVPREQLLAVARERILQPPPLHRPSLRVGNNPISAMLIRSRTARLLAAKTGENYPAPFEALEVITHGTALPVEKSLALERDAMARLAQSDACRNLLRLFLAVQHARKGAPGRGEEGGRPQVQRAAVVGAGVMGAGIAQWLSSHKLSVILRDVNLEKLIRGVDTIAQIYAEAVRRQHLNELEARDGKDRIFAAASDVPLREVDLVIEAATENLALKQDIFRCLAAQTPRSTILATNTSALSVTELAAATEAADRVVGLHFFNPVHRMELVEVVAGEKTSSMIRERAMDFVRRIGKVPILVRDSPGFVVNRVLMPYLVEAVRLFDSGVEVNEIDQAMLKFGMPMGPLRVLDEVGLDVAANVVASLMKHYGARVAPPPLVEKMIASQMTGRKSGSGNGPSMPRVCRSRCWVRRRAATSPRATCSATAPSTTSNTFI